MIGQMFLPYTAGTEMSNDKGREDNSGMIRPEDDFPASKSSSVAAPQE